MSRLQLECIRASLIGETADVPTVEALIRRFAGSEGVWGQQSAYGLLEDMVGKVLTALRESGLNRTTFEEEYADEQTTQALLDDVMVEALDPDIRKSLAQVTGDTLGASVRAAAKLAHKRAPRWAKTDSTPEEELMGAT